MNAQKTDDYRLCLYMNTQKTQNYRLSLYMNTQKTQDYRLSFYVNTQKTQDYRLSLYALKCPNLKVVFDIKIYLCPYFLSFISYITFCLYFNVHFSYVKIYHHHKIIINSPVIAFCSSIKIIYSPVFLQYSCIKIN
jgi:hypothetical protein